MSFTRAPARLALAGLSTVALVACGSSGSPSSASSSGSSSAAGSSSGSTITISDFSFTTPDSVSPGAEVTVDNEDSAAHTVTADEGNAFDDAADAGVSTFTAPTKPGSYPFHCNFHPGMHGTLVVK
jgi:plastocyanin